MGIDVHHCPRCELRFANVAELRDHFDHDHHADPDTFSRYRYGRRVTDRGAPTASVVVVANQTLLDDGLLARVRERAAAAPVVLLVPATHSAHLAGAPGGATLSRAGEGRADDVGLATARWRLRTALERLEEQGVAVEGRVGHPDPFRAVIDLAAEREIGEVILSTLPAGLSRWLEADLPTRLGRRLGVPVTTLTPTA
jgi:hypothetical protein